jgi:hypothetical protein
MEKILGYHETVLIMVVKSYVVRVLNTRQNFEPFLLFRSSNSTTTSKSRRAPTTTDAQTNRGQGKQIPFPAEAFLDAQNSGECSI